MGMRFKKSFKAGPVRFTASKPGVSYSVGTKGLRVTKTAGGKTRTTVGVPGTGVSYSTSSRSSQARTTTSYTNSRNTKKKSLWAFWVGFVFLCFGGVGFLAKAPAHEIALVLIGGIVLLAVHIAINKTPNKNKKRSELADRLSGLSDEEFLETEQSLLRYVKTANGNIGEETRQLLHAVREEREIRFGE